MIFAWIYSLFSTICTKHDEHGEKKLFVNGQPLRFHPFEIDNMSSAIAYDEVETIQQLIFEEVGIWFSQKRIIAALREKP